MAGRHHVFLERLSSRQRLIIGVGVVLWLFILVGLIAFLHEDNTTPLADPAPPIYPGFSPPVPVLPAPTSASGVPPSASTRPTTTAPSRSATTAPPPGQRTTPPPAAARAFTANYIISRNTGSTFQVGILLANKSDAARSWEIRVTHDPAARVRVQTSFGARVSRSGETTLFSGGPLRAGGSVLIGFEASKQTSGVVRPTDCQVDGRACIVIVQ